MTKLEAVLERIAKLPQDEQDRIAFEIEFLLNQPNYGEALLTPEQWADVERAWADTTEATISNDAVFAGLQKP